MLLHKIEFRWFGGNERGFWTRLDRSDIKVTTFLRDRDKHDSLVSEIAGLRHTIMQNGGDEISIQSHTRAGQAKRCGTETESDEFKNYSVPLVTARR